MNRTQRLKTKLFEMDDGAIFLSRMEILKDCADTYRNETAGIKFGHTLQVALMGKGVRYVALLGEPFDSVQPGLKIGFGGARHILIGRAE